MEAQHLRFSIQVQMTIISAKTSPDQVGAMCRNK